MDDGTMQPVSLPYMLRDDTGRQWQVRPDGTVGDASADYRDGGRKLACSSTDFPACQQAMLDPRTNELTFGPMPVGDLRVTRRVRLDAKTGLCRSIDLFENPTDHDVRVQIDLYSKLAGPERACKVITKDAGSSPRQVLLTDGTAALGLICGGQSCLMPSTFDFKASAFGGTQHLSETNVPARQTIALIHAQIRRASADEVLNFLKTFGDEQLLAGLPAEAVKLAVNFPPPGTGNSIAPVRGAELDVLETRSGDSFTGTVRLEVDAAATRPGGTDAYGIETSFGAVTLARSQVVSIIGAGDAHLRQIVLTRGGEAFSGRLAARNVGIELPNGQAMHIPLDQIKSIGFRLAAEEKPATKPTTGAAVNASVPFVPYVQLRSGDLLHISVPDTPLPLTTRYGSLQLPPAVICAILFQRDDAGYAVTLTDGSAFGSLLTTGELPFHLIGSAGQRDITVPVAMIAKLQIANPADKIDGPAATGGILKLAEDVFVATMTSQVTLDTPFETAVIDAAPIAAITRVEDSRQNITVTMWDGTRLSGTAQETSWDFKLSGGSKLSVPLALVHQYTQGQPQIPPQVKQRLQTLATQLASADDAQRAQAQALLSAIGPKIIPALEELRASQPKPIQDRLDEIIALLRKG